MALNKVLEKDIAYLRGCLDASRMTVKNRNEEIALLLAEVDRLRAVESAARAVVTCEAGYSTESYCDAEWNALVLMLNMVAPGREIASGEAS
jgi:acetone carboxylase gamma subunit